MRVEVEDAIVVEEQNNETLRKKSKKSKSKGESSDKTALLKSLVAEYSRDERAKKNRRGRKSANLSKLFQMQFKTSFCLALVYICWYVAYSTVRYSAVHVAEHIFKGVKRRMECASPSL